MVEVSDLGHKFDVLCKVPMREIGRYIVDVVEGGAECIWEIERVEGEMVRENVLTPELPAGSVWIEF